MALTIVSLILAIHSLTVFINLYYEALLCKALREELLWKWCD